jgi:DnaK suppressor protein
MNNYEDWANLVAKKLKGEGDVIAAIDKDELDDTAATEVFVRTVLKPFLPENFGIGAGRIVDAFGNRSDYLDIVIYNRSFPRIGLPGTQSDYLYESVLAGFAIRSKYVRKTFFDSMDACASMARLVTNVDKSVLVRLARRNGLKPGPNKTFVHEDAIRTARFELIGSPPVFMYGFTGIKHSYRQLQENIELWIEQRNLDDVDLPMRAFPAVIATQGCFAWRNAAPLSLSNREMLGVGNDHAPVRLIVLQLLYLLNRRLNMTSDGYGLKPNLSAYLSQFSAPRFELGVGDVDELVSVKMVSNDDSKADESSRQQPARDHAHSPANAEPAAATAVKQVAEPATETSARATNKPAPKTVKQAAANAAATSKPDLDKTAESKSEPVSEAKADAGTSSGVFDKPSQFASAPAAKAAEQKEEPARRTPPTSSLGSAPIPGVDSSHAAKPASKSPASSPLGSAPIPDMATPADKEPAARLPVASLGSAPIPMSDSILDDDSILPLPPIDIELTDTFPIPENMPEEILAELPAELPEESEDEAEPDFEDTMVIAPDASLSKKSSGNSTEAFIERVKEQLSDSPAKSNDKPFIATVPQ